MSKEIKVIDLGWSMARLTVNDLAITLEILTPSIESGGKVIDATSLSLYNDSVRALKKLLEEIPGEVK